MIPYIYRGAGMAKRAIYSAIAVLLYLGFLLIPTVATVAAIVWTLRAMNVIS